MKGQKKWCFINKATYEDKKPESVTSQCGLKQVVSDPTHMQPSSVMNPGVHPSSKLSSSNNTCKI